MTGAITWDQLAFFIALLSVVAGVWWRIEGKVRVAEDKAGKVAADLADHKLHIAETYITKAGMRETTEQIMDAIHGVKQAVDHMTVRVDRIVENQVKPRASRPG